MALYDSMSLTMYSIGNRLNVAKKIPKLMDKALVQLARIASKCYRESPAVTLFAFGSTTKGHPGGYITC